LSNYTKSTNFATKDNLTPGDPLKIVRGTEIDTEFNNIATAIATKTDNASAAITGGTINDTTIGATTASTGAFTTLAASGNVTLSGGTANGVAYLNGSKVVTSGSALTFDGTTTTTPKVVTSATSGLVANWNAGLNDNQIYGQVTQSLNNLQYGVFSGGTAFLASGNNYPLTFYINGSEQMRLTSTGLGIGTSSPAAKLEISGATQATGAVVRLTNSAESSSWAAGDVIGQFDFYSSDSSDAAIKSRITSVVESGGTNPTAVGFAFSTYNTSLSEKMRLDSSGNLGLGVTPSASTLPTIQSTYGVLSGNTNISILRNAYYNSGWKYTATGAATFYQHDGGSHIWYNAPSGTAGNAITFTQAMTLDSSGNLLVGTTTASNTPSQGITLMQNTSVGSIGIGHANGTTSGNGYLNFAYNGSAIGSVTQDGTTAVLYNTTSDQRLKENIQDADSASSLIDSLQVRQFDWKSDNSHQRYGFVAQELVTVAPEAVHQPLNEEEMMAVDYSKLVPMLVKEIQSLRVRVAQLESN
jgi:hypothetical protein